MRKTKLLTKLKENRDFRKYSWSIYKLRITINYCQSYYSNKIGVANSHTRYIDKIRIDQLDFIFNNDIQNRFFIA